MFKINKFTLRIIATVAILMVTVSFYAASLKQILFITLDFFNF